MRVNICQFSVLFKAAYVIVILPTTLISMGLLSGFVQYDTTELTNAVDVHVDLSLIVVVFLLPKFLDKHVIEKRILWNFASKSW